MGSQNEHFQAPVTNIPTPEMQDAFVIHEPDRQTFPLHLLLPLILVTGAVYGVLALSEPQKEISNAQAAAIADILPNSFDSLSLEAQSAFVADISENKIVHTKNADAQLPLASLTKIMLVLVASDVLLPADTVIVSETATLRGEGGGPAAGEVWRVKDLIDFTLVVSSNVGAEALAEAASEKIRVRYPHAPEEGATVWRMNALAKELGLSKTYFLNASGLDISPTQPSAMGSARDAAILLAYAYKTKPDVFKATSQATLVVGPAGGLATSFDNTNEAIAQIRGLKIGKTGYTDLAGGNLGIIFTASPNHTFVAAVLASSQAGRFTDILAIVAKARR